MHRLLLILPLCLIVAPNPREAVSPVRPPELAPVIALDGELAERLGIREFHITISHCRAYATATALAVRG